MSPRPAPPSAVNLVVTTFQALDAVLNTTAIGNATGNATGNGTLIPVEPYDPGDYAESLRVAAASPFTGPSQLSGSYSGYGISGKVGLSQYLFSIFISVLCSGTKPISAGSVRPDCQPRPWGSTQHLRHPQWCHYPQVGWEHILCNKCSDREIGSS